MSTFFLFAGALNACTLTVAAASDLLNLQAPLSQSVPGCQVRLVFGSSGMLARQIEQGAPYDVFLSADERRVGELRRGGHIDGEPLLYGLGRLAIWSKSGNYRTLKDLKAHGLRHVAIANPAHAPYGLAARQALERGGLWDELKAKLVYGESVRQALEYSASGNAEAALVAWSLVHRRGGVLVDARLHEPIRQAGAVLARSGQKPAARRLLTFLASAAGRTLLLDNGFEAAW